MPGCIPDVQPLPIECFPARLIMIKCSLLMTYTSLPSKLWKDYRAFFISPVHPVHHSSAQGEANLSANLLRWKSVVRAGGTGGNTVPVLLLAHACFAFEF